ncbi:MAG: hypothetical protein V1824_01825 [archaeon]
MDIEFIKKTKNEIEINVPNEDISFFRLIVKCASSKKEVEFTSIKEADHLAKQFTIYIRTRTENAKDFLLSCIEEVEEDLAKSVKKLEKEISKTN